MHSGLAICFQFFLTFHLGHFQGFFMSAQVLLDPSGPFRTIYVLLGPFMSFQDHLDPFRTIQILLGPFRSFWVLSGPFRSFQDLSGPFGSFWILPGPFRTFQAFKTFQVLLGPRSVRFFQVLLSPFISYQSFQVISVSCQVLLRPFRSFQDNLSPILVLLCTSKTQVLMDHIRLFYGCFEVS